MLKRTFGGQLGILWLSAILILMGAAALSAYEAPTSFGVYAVEGDRLVPIPKQVASAYVKPWLSEPARISANTPEAGLTKIGADSLTLVVYLPARAGKLCVSKALWGIKDSSLLLFPLAGGVSEASKPGQGGEIVEIRIPGSASGCPCVLYMLSSGADLVELSFWYFASSQAKVTQDIQWTPFYCITPTGDAPSRLLIGSKNGTYSIVDGHWVWLPLSDGAHLISDNIRFILADPLGGDSMLCAIGDKGLYIALERYRWKSVPLMGTPGAVCLDQHVSRRCVLMSLIKGNASDGYTCDIARTLDAGRMWDWDWKDMGSDLVFSMAAGAQTLMLGSTAGLHLSYLNEKGKEKFRKISKKDLRLYQKWRFKVNLRQGFKINVPSYFAQQVFCIGEGDRSLLAEFKRDNGNSVVMYSDDAGTTWDTLPSPAPFELLSASPADGKFIAVGCNGGISNCKVYRFAGPRDSWEAIPYRENLGCLQFACNPVKTNHFFALVTDKSIVETPDGGQTWNDFLRPPFGAATVK
ncbi:MAG: hypothetical protein HY851_11695 [candidate division Zixibacteria bacterium]|nr:hypothetical protein [candidate division Zixibacteria bacterium]